MNGITFVATKEHSKEAKLKMENMLKRREERIKEITLKFSNMENLKHTTTDMVRNGNMATLECCIGSNLMYSYIVEDIKYTVPVDVSDRAEVGDATFNLTEKVMFIMRWINKAIKNNELRWETTIS
jgi:recombinational DNA repair protein RecT